jgi:hypothetical protein
MRYHCAALDRAPSSLAAASTSLAHRVAIRSTVFD